MASKGRSNVVRVLKNLAAELASDLAARRNLSDGRLVRHAHAFMEDAIEQAHA